MVKSAKSAAAILDTALEMADETGWEAVRLYQVAARLGIGLDELSRYYREKEDLVEAWFDRADRAMLRATKAQGFSTGPHRVKLERLILAWLDSLASHRRVTRQMIMGKLEPGHLHVQIPALLRVSRTVQWLREAAGLDSRYLRRAIEETGLTATWLMIFCRWLWDDSEDVRATRRLMDRLLTAGERLTQCCRTRPSAGETSTGHLSS